MTKDVVIEKKDGTNLKIGIVYAKWHSAVCNILVERCKQGLLDCSVKNENILLVDVPGSFEVVYGAAQLIKKESVDAVICIGTLIKGETMHFEYIAESVSNGIMNLNISTDVPVIFGVLTCLSIEQAKKRAGEEMDHGYQWGLSAVQMGLLKVSEAKKIERPQRI